MRCLTDCRRAPTRSLRKSGFGAPPQTRLEGRATALGLFTYLGFTNILPPAGGDHSLSLLPEAEPSGSEAWHADPGAECETDPGRAWHLIGAFPAPLLDSCHQSGGDRDARRCARARRPAQREAGGVS